MAISQVFSFCAPTQVFKPVVISDAVEMPAYHAFRGWPDKSQQHQPSQPYFCSVSSEAADVDVTTASVRAVWLSSAGISDLSEVTDLDG